MHYLIWSGRIATPMAMVAILFYEITHSVNVEGWWFYVIMAGALGSAIGIEIVGILSGVTLERFWRIDDRPRTLLALVLLITYTIVAMYILRHNTILWPIPIIAAVVYLVSALAESAGEIIEQQVTSQADDAAWQRRQEEQEAEFERQLKLQQQRDRTAVKLAKLESEPAQSQHSASIEPAHSYQCEDCYRTFGTVQALNAHSRFCSGEPAPSANGHAQ
jgi:hypothetical protein